ncbi:MAG TPA: type II toxin-antitoxin system VapC family toxin, partial [Gemmataceae bacterium]|nr:type II toxin-antitoxin system VapC family toxin [Gemmataceae bacterium]
RVRDGGMPMHAPNFLDVEVGNILWKKIVRSELTRAAADDLLAQLPRQAITRHDSAGFLNEAFEIACRTGRTVYDCLYLALAVQLGGRMVTADEKFVNSLAATPWVASVLRLQDVP